MLENRILLTTPTYPYPTLPANDSLTDATGQRFTKGDDIFSLISHTHCFANHILAQNVDTPTVLLEYPRWEDFTAEIDKGYPVVGISAYPVHLDRVLEMCRYVRQRSPATKILLGSYAGQAFQASYDEAEQSQYVDGVVSGEGVRFMRSLLGEATDRPIRQALMPKAGGTVPYISRYPKGAVGFLVSGLGCIGGCDFCSTTALFDRKRIELLSPKELVEHMHLYFQHFPDVRQVFVVEEDHFRQPAYLDEMRPYWMGHPEMMEAVDWFGFGSIDHIGKFAKKYGWDAIAELGLGTVFIGVESKFAGDHGYDKRDEIDAAECFSRLHSMGIRTVGAWICGWDFHDHTNIHEDLNYFVSLMPTYQQLTRLSPFPGTALWDRLKEEGRIDDVPWEDVHFWSGAQKNLSLAPHETLNLTEYGYDLLYRTWGPSLLRRLDVLMNGYEYCRRSDNPVLRRHRALHFKRQSATFWLLLKGMDRFAPNGVVRRRVRKADERYRQLIGEPTPVMKAVSGALDGLATALKARQLVDPINRHPKEEPFKRYTYDKAVVNGSPVPYKTEWPGGSPIKVKAERALEEVRYTTIDMALRGVRAAGWRNRDAEVDDYIQQMVRRRALGFGF